MPIDSISFAFKGTAPSLTVKGTKVNLATSTDTLKLPNGKTISGFKADDGTFFQLKKKQSGGSEIVIHGEKANLKNWNFKVKGGALSKMSLADGSRYKADNLVFAKKEKSYIFDSTFKQVDHGLSKRPPSTGGLVGEMDQEIPSTPLTAKRRKLAENVDAQKLDALLRRGDEPLTPGQFKRVAHLLTDREIDTLNDFAATATDPTKRKAAENLIDSFNTGLRLLDSEGVDKVRASMNAPANSGLRTAALEVLNQARTEGDRARAFQNPLDRTVLPSLPLSDKQESALTKGINEGKFDRLIPPALLKAALPFLSPAELSTLSQYLENPSGSDEKERVTGLLNSLKGGFEHLSEKGGKAFDAYASAPTSENKQSAKIFFDSARKAGALERRHETSTKSNNAVLERQGLKRVKVTGDGNCFFHAAKRNISKLPDSSEGAMSYREGLAKTVERGGGEVLLRQMNEKDPNKTFTAEMAPMDASFLSNLRTDASGVRDGSSSAAWGNIQHARLLAASEGKPVVIIAPDDQGGSHVLMPDFSHRPLKADGKDDVFTGSTNPLTRPIVLVFDGVNHWDAGVPKTD